MRLRHQDDMGIDAGCFRLPTVAQQQTVATTAARDAFMNAVRILYSMEPFFLEQEQYDRFIDAPMEFLMTADEQTLQKVWDAVQARQPARYRAA